ncbi:MAG: hypothetical protein JNN01_18985 [Opitutaceae bacterium]|nr:hypothetical protein [Opitutaceae bacterium]
MSHYLLGDDLSGVLEAGAAFRDQGWRVVLPLVASEAGAGPDLLRLVTTESRNLSAVEAAAAVRRVVRQGRESGQTLVLKKIDSTLRGPLGAELGAIVAELAPPLMVVCSANPAAGRTIRNGVLRVHGVPLAETDFRHDPHWPARESRVREHLRAQGLEVAGELTQAELNENPGDALRRIRLAGTVVLADTVEKDDLRRLVRAVRREEPKALFVGSGALATVLAQEQPSPGSAPPNHPDLPPLLLLSGTHHPATHRQLDHLARTTGIQVRDHWVGRDDFAAGVASVTAAYRERPLVALRLGADERLGAEASTAVLAAAAEFAVVLERELHPKAWFVTGGETAWRVCHALHGTALEVLSEIEPGVVASTLWRAQSPPCTLITKPGGFGDAAALNRICGFR